MVCVIVLDEKRLLPHPFNHLEEKIFFQLT